VLKPEVVRVFLDALQQGRELSPPTAAVIAQARTGAFVVPPDNGTTLDGDEPARAFVRGLAALQKNQIAQAASWFQLTLKGAPDFLGAAFYLGAVHAAGGRDRDAVGAWQMSLVGDGGERAYPMLVDALLRVGDAPAALDLIAEAPEAWASDAARRRRVAVAQAMLGQYATALETVTDLLRTNPDDVDLLFVALQVLYRRHTDAPLAAEDRQRFAAYAAKYEQQRGPQAALVASWRKYLTK
jgi:tetratricopeptide (TPR) repeat protein